MTNETNELPEQDWAQIDREHASSYCHPPTDSGVRYAVTDAQRIAWADLEDDNLAEARKQATPTERQNRIAVAKQALHDFRKVVNERPGGGVLLTDDALAQAMAAIPMAKSERYSVLTASIRRVKAMTAVTSTEKLCFEYIALSTMSDTRHCYRLRSQIGAALGIDHLQTITRAMASLAKKGLIYLLRGHGVSGNRTAGRLFAVPALMPVDRQKIGDEVSISHQLGRVSAACGSAGVAFPNRSAIKLADALAKDTHPVPPFKIEPGTPLPPHNLNGPNRGKTSGNDWKSATGASRDPTLQLQAGFDRQENPVRIDANSDGLALLTSPDDLTDARRKSAHAACQYLTAAEIKLSFARYIKFGNNAKWRGFINGLSHDDERKRQTAMRKLKTAPAFAAFAHWDRAINGNAKAALGERLERFLADPIGSRFVITAKSAGKRFKDALGDDDRSFEIKGNRLHFHLSGPRSICAISLIQTVRARCEVDVLLALEATIGDWNRRGVKLSADFEADMAASVQEHLDNLYSPDLFF